MASSYTSGAASAFSAVVGTASGKREQMESWGHVLGTYFRGQREYYAQATSGRAI